MFLPLITYGIGVAAVVISAKKERAKIEKQQRLAEFLDQMKSEVIQQDEQKRVRMLSYNIFIRPPGVMNNDGGDWKDERLREFTQFIDNYDIIALQEFYSTLSNRRHRFIEYAKEHGLSFCAEGSVSTSARLTGKLLDSGLLLLSRYPVVEQDFVVFRDSIQEDKLLQKGALYVLLQIGSARMQFVNTHLQSSYTDGRPSEPNRRTRRAQIEELRRFIESKLQNHPGVPLILFGTLNVNARPDPNSEEDLVIGGGIHSAEYSEAIIDSLLNIDFTLRPTDLLATEGKQHPVTYSDTYFDEKIGALVACDSVLTHKSALFHPQCLDYAVYYPSTQAQYQLQKLIIATEEPHPPQTNEDNGGEIATPFQTAPATPHEEIGSSSLSPPKRGSTSAPNAVSPDGASFSDSYFDEDDEDEDDADADDEWEESHQTKPMSQIFRVIPDDEWKQIEQQSQAQTSSSTTLNLTAPTEGTKIIRFNVEPDSTHIERFKVPHTENTPYQQLSDHFGIATTFVLTVEDGRPPPALPPQPDNTRKQRSKFGWRAAPPPNDRDFLL